RKTLVHRRSLPRVGSNPRHGVQRTRRIRRGVLRQEGTLLDQMRNEPVALVTGAGGFVGTHLCRLLASRGEPFVGTLSPRGHEPALVLTSQPAALFRSIDLQDSIAVRDLVAEVAPTRIFNLAAVGTHPLERYDPFAYVELNVRLPAALFQFMPRGCILVHVGSMKQYTGCIASLSEDTASRDSSTLYSWSKN